MKAKKILTLLLTFLMLLSLVSCKKDVKKADSEKPKETSGLKFKPGKYNGEAQGHKGTIKVEVEVDETSIKSVKVVEHQETKGISDKAIENIPKDILKYQSVNVDTVATSTNSSKGIIEAVKNALKESGVDMKLLEKEIKKEATESKKIEKQADVIIVGAGGAGLAAAVSALENGATVIVIEKMAIAGGSTIIAGGQYNAVDDARQQKIKMRQDLINLAEASTKEKPVNDKHQAMMDTLKKQIEEYKKNKSEFIFDSPELHALQAFKGGDYKGDLELIETLTKGAEQSITWLEKLGVKFRDEIATVTGALWPRTHQFVKPLVTGPIEAYLEFIKKQGDKAEMMYETKAEDLIVENGQVVGVKAKQGNNEVVLKANRGVILATGGFARNAELIKKHDKHWGGLEKLGSTNSVSATGDGITLAEKVNANLVGMEYIQLLPVGDPQTGGMQGNISINAANQLFVNKEGKRFVAEDARRDTLTQGLLKQPDQVMWILHDAHEYTDENVKNDFNEKIGDLVKDGKVSKGETIEELAKNMGVDPAALKATVDDYNQAVAGKKADTFGKKLLQDPFDKAPFYASKRVPTIHHTMGGLQINSKAEVLSKDGKVIKGLYAAGEVTGGIHGANRLGGNAIPDTVVFGKIAGESAAKNK